ncbi:glutaminyl-peptide cyclotransferase [Chloroflexota bacterium]
MKTARIWDKLLVGCLLSAVVATTVSCTVYPKTREDEQKATPRSVPTYTFTILDSYIHDRDAFTQGLAFENGALYEGTGLHGKSSLRRVDLKTGNVLQVYTLPYEYFGEGITIFRDTVIQLTQRSKKGFVYDKNSFDVLREFTYETEGWGITHDGKRLIMSDGTSTLYFLDADTFEIIDHIQVHGNNKPINNLNELEFIDGQIYANIWLTENIAIIDPQDGRVTGWIDLSGILPPQSDGKPVDVLNGIAYDAANGRLFVTGKLWPQLFEIELMTKQ